jgi:cobalamin biosynthesis protein CobT
MVPVFSLSDKQDKSNNGGGSDADPNKDKKDESGKKDKSDKKDKEDKKDKGEKSDDEDSDEGDDSDDGDQEGGDDDSDQEGDEGDQEGDDNDGDSDNDGDGDKEGGDKPSDKDSDKEGDGEGKGNKPSDKEGKESKSQDGGEVESNKPRMTPEQAKDAIEKSIGSTPAQECEDYLRKEVNRIMKDINFYTADRSKDTHTTAKPDEYMLDNFNKVREGLGIEIAQLIRTAEQAFYSMKRTRIIRGVKHGDIDLTRLPSIAKGLSPNVYARKTEGTDLNTAVSIVIDLSGSMGSSLKSVEKVLAALGEMFAKIGIPFEIFGTSTFSPVSPNTAFTRWKGVQYHHYKHFEENWNAVKGRVTSLASMGNNIDGEAVEYAAVSLMQRKETRKIVFSINDGEPCAGQGDDGVFAHHLKKTCDKVRGAGVEVYAIGINTSNPATYYGKNNFIEMNSGSSLFSTEIVKTLVDTVMQGKFKK